MSDLQAPPVDGRYQVVRELGRSATGIRSEALDRTDGHRVLLHQAPPPASTPQPAVDRFLDEAERVGRLGHQHLVAVEDRLDRSLVLELLSGRSLDTVIAAGPADLGFILIWLQQACLGLKAAHAAGVVHWGIKPSRLFLTDQGRVKLLGFGTAHLAPATATGNAPYLAPEQWRQEPADGRADLYALGCVLFELCAGRPPYAGASPQELMHRHLNDAVPYPSLVRADLPPGLDQVVLALLAKDPGARPADAADAAARIGAVAAGHHGALVPPPQEGLIRAQVDQAWAFGEAGQGLEAVRQLTALVAHAARTLGAGHPQTLQVAYDLAIWRGMTDDIAGAAGLLGDLVPLMIATLGPGDEDVAKATRDLWSFRGDLERRRHRGIARPGELAMLLGLPVH
ncbi:serine/threonine protein kinase [Kitasatospora sp. NBC_01287]|uniref:serine/threonine-protein kinase n=1 Tax=Kitasatospora sp. NBC_01287 TaxID=2903573 RepID=UPI0022509D54|nr:serine/threonine-protein kinase [Kitasatospora sp. NBC_01287]MCX4746765.1 serine/threonine protein kinase [Kitasatospora sp. NBC_01287]